MKYDVFISYSSKDQKIAEGICGYLERNKIRCFVAYRDIAISDTYPKKISNALNKSHLMVAVYSQSYNVSKETDREITIASKHNIPILTFRICNDEMDGTKEYFLSDVNWIDAFPEPERYFGCLLESIQKLLNTSINNTTSVFNTKYFFVKNRLSDLTEPNRHAVYAHYFPSANDNSNIAFLKKTKECLEEMYAFHRFLGYEEDKAREDYLLAEWLTNNNRLDETILKSVVNTYCESTTSSLAHAIYDYRTKKSIEVSLVN